MDQASTCGDGNRFAGGGGVLLKLDTISRVSLLPLFLSVLLWVFPGASGAGGESESAVGSGGVEGTRVEQRDSALPGVELPLVGLASSIVLLLALRTQTSLEGKARQRW